MLVVKAISKVYKNGKHIGWKMMDEQGNLMDATTESIKSAIINCQVHAVNLTVTASGDLRMLTADELRTKELIRQKKSGVKSSIKKLEAPSYYGVTIKNLKTYRGREGEAYQGDVWLNGNKLGFWSQDANGCISDRFEFDKLTLLESLHKHQKERGKQTDSTESFMVAVVSNIENYKTYKNMIKKGAKALIHIHDYYGIYNTFLGCRITDKIKIENMNHDEIQKYLDKYTMDGKPASYEIYTCDEDFIVE